MTAADDQAPSDGAPPATEDAVDRPELERGMGHPREGDVMPAASVAGITEVLTAVAGLQETVSGMRDALCAAEARLSNLEMATDVASRQIAFLPPQIRMLAAKIEGLTTSVSEPRLRAVLLGLLSVYDLVEQARRALLNEAPTDAGAVELRHYEVLRTQLRQLLEANGLSEISGDGPFDPLVHRAIERVPVTDPTQADGVVSVLRPGFRTEQSVLRYAEVSVAHYTPAENPAEAGGATDAPAPESGTDRTA